MTEESFTKKLIKIAKDLDKLRQVTENAIKDIKALVPEVKSKDDEGKSEPK